MADASLLQLPFLLRPLHLGNVQDKPERARPLSHLPHPHPLLADPTSLLTISSDKQGKDCEAGLEGRRQLALHLCIPKRDLWGRSRLQVWQIVGNRQTYQTGLQQSENSQYRAYDCLPPPRLPEVRYFLLHADKNKLCSPIGLDSLLHLRYLNLSHNQIKDISGLACLKKLAHLAVEYNQI